MVAVALKKSDISSTEASSVRVANGLECARGDEWSHTEDNDRV